MLLRESSSASGGSADLTGVVGEGDAAGVPAGALLLAYADAANRDPSGSLALHDEMLDVVGPAGLVEAASTVAIFNGLVRSADAIGIPLDGIMLAATSVERTDLGLGRFGGARNTPTAGA